MDTFAIKWFFGWKFITNPNLWIVFFYNRSGTWSLLGFISFWIYFTQLCRSLLNLKCLKHCTVPLKISWTTLTEYRLEYKRTHMKVMHAECVHQCRKIHMGFGDHPSSLLFLLNDDDVWVFSLTSSWKFTLLFPWRNHHECNDVAGFLFYSTTSLKWHCEDQVTSSPCKGNCHKESQFKNLEAG